MAAPGKNFDPVNEAEPVKETPGNPQQIDDNNLMIRENPPPPTRSREAARYYHYRQALSPRILGGITTDSEDSSAYGVGIAYQWPKVSSPYAEIGADVVTPFGGYLNFGVKHVFFERNFFRPNFIWGLSHELVAREKLATFTNIDNYYARISVGFERVTQLPQSFRLEVQAMVGIEKILVLLGIGYVWAW